MTHRGRCDGCLLTRRLTMPRRLTTPRRLATPCNAVCAAALWLGVAGHAVAALEDFTPARRIGSLVYHGVLYMFEQ